MTQPTPTPTQDPNTGYYLRVLHELIDMGADLARQIHREATAPAKPGANPTPPPPTEAFDRIARAIRRTILLARKVAEPLPITPTHAQARKAARKEILRQVEHAIYAETTGQRAETLRAELHDRLDSPEFADDLATRPLDHIIEDIRRDLGVAAFQKEFKYQRRTPEQVLALCLRAAAGPGHQPRPAPQPPTEKPRATGKKALTLVQDG